MNALRRLKPGEVAFGWLMLAVGLFFLWQSYRISGFSSLSSPGGTPMAASALMVICALVIIVRNRRSPRLEVENLRAAAQRFGREVLPAQPLIVYLLVMLGYMAAIEPLGFNLASVFFLFTSFWYLHRKGVWLATWLSILTVSIIYVTFQLVFQVVLPKGDLIEAALRAVGW